jgi:hypothetical protein
MQASLRLFKSNNRLAISKEYHISFFVFWQEDFLSFDTENLAKAKTALLATVSVKLVQARLLKMHQSIVPLRKAQGLRRFVM